MIKLLFPKIILENPRSLIKRSVESERVGDDGCQGS